MGCEFALASRPAGATPRPAQEIVGWRGAADAMTVPFDRPLRAWPDGA